MENESLKKQLEKFDFSVLFRDQEESGFLKYLPLINLILETVIIIILLWKK